MGIISFGFTQPYLPRLGMVDVAVGAIGSLEAVIEKKGQAAADWRFETGVVGIVFRTSNPTNMIHVAYEEAELENLTASVISARSSAQHEIGWLGIGTPQVVNAANKGIKKRNIYFCATNSSGARVAERILIELYTGIG